jgi:hypothetical protein
MSYTEMVFNLIFYAAIAFASFMAIFSIGFILSAPFRRYPPSKHEEDMPDLEQSVQRE